MKRPMVLMIAALVLVFGAIFGVIEGKKLLVARYLASYEPPPVTVSAEAVRTERWDVVIGAVGTLRAVQGVDLAAEAPGIVTALRFKPGDQVKTLRGSMHETIVRVLEDGRVVWRADSDAELTALPESLLREQER